MRIPGLSRRFLGAACYLSSWVAYWQGNTAKLEWAAPTDNATGFYEVQYSTNGAAWKTLAVIAATPQAGATAHYTYSTSSATVNQNYFRLKLAYGHGEYSHSGIRILTTRQRRLGNLQVIPNPVAADFTLQQNGSAVVQTLQLLDLTGKLVKHFTRNSSNRYTLAGVAPGCYLLLLTLSDGRTVTEKINRL